MATLSCGNPFVSSSPMKMTIFCKKKMFRNSTINFQSSRKKGKLLEVLICDTTPDAILSTETWLDESIKSGEIILNNLKTLSSRELIGTAITTSRHLCRQPGGVHSKTACQPCSPLITAGTLQAVSFIYF